MFGVTFRMTITSDGLSGINLAILSTVEMAEGGLDVALKVNSTFDVSSRKF
jgi:hypothetical protein